MTIQPTHALLISQSGDVLLKIYQQAPHNQTAAEIERVFEEQIQCEARKMAPFVKGGVTVYRPVTRFIPETSTPVREERIANRFEEDEAEYRREQREATGKLRCAERAEEILSQMFTSGEPDQKTKFEMLAKELKVRKGKPEAGTFFFGYSIVDILVALYSQIKK